MVETPVNDPKSPEMLIAYPTVVPNTGTEKEPQVVPTLPENEPLPLVAAFVLNVNAASVLVPPDSDPDEALKAAEPAAK